MKVNFNQPFKDQYGCCLIEKDGKPLLIGRELGQQLFNLGDLNKTPLSQEQKFMAYTLSVKIANATEEVEITEKEAEFIDKVAYMAFKAGAYGNIKDLIS